MSSASMDHFHGGASKQWEMRVIAVFKMGHWFWNFSFSFPDESRDITGGFCCQLITFFHWSGWS